MTFPAILETSFLRCLKYGLHRNDPMNGEILTPKLLKEIKEENRTLIEHTLPVMEKLSPFLKEAGHVAVLSDTGGNILLSYGEADSLTKMQIAQIQPGANWLEQNKGTNAIGTALIEKKPVRVHAGEHFFQANGILTCSASPVYSPDGRLLGVFDISGIHSSEISYALSLAVMAAENIQSRLLLDSYRKESTQKKFQIHISENPLSTITYSFSGIYAACEKMKSCIALARKASQTDYTILLEGETGTGKEAFAQSIHRDSHRNARPFVAVNCSSIPESLIESELFGYSGGAFTGSNQKGGIGKFQAAHGGTIFLDEICGMSLRVQAALLRVLQERRITPVGASRETPIDVRVIAAANQSLEKLVKNGSFRSDLYYRLKGITISLPALRNRTDLEGLVGDILREIGKSAQLEEGAWKLLKKHPFPGNIRELHSILLQAVFQSENGLINRELLQSILSAPSGFPECSQVQGDDHVSLKDAEKHALVNALESSDGNISRAAKVLGIGRTTFYRKMSEFGLKELSIGT